MELQHNIPNLQGNTTYQIEVRALNGALPPKPTRWIKMGEVATRAVDISTTDIKPVFISSVTANYDVKENPPGTDYEIVGSIFEDFRSTHVVHVTKDINSTDVEGLAGATPYYFKIRAVNHGGLPTAWKFYDVITTGEPPFPPTPPAGLHVIAVTSGTIRLG